MNMTKTKKLLTGFAMVVLVMAQVPTVSAATEAELLSANDAAAAYLEVQQQPDGSIAGYGGETDWTVTDWTVIAVVANGQNPEEVASAAGASLVDALESDPLDTTASATDVERRILAIAAAEQDTKDFGGVNYNELLNAQHINDQIGGETLLNDDAFGVLAVAATEDPDLLPMAQDAVDYLLKNQDVSGGFGWATVDNAAYSGPDSNSTAAAIIALHTADELGLASANLTAGTDAAVTYLLALQQPDGGFVYDAFSTESDGSSTAWGLMALNTVGGFLVEAQAAQAWLLDHQNKDGGFYYGPWGMTDSDTYTTPHAMLALLGTNWLLSPQSIRQLTPEIPVVAPTAKPVAANTTAEPQATAVVTAATSETPTAATLAVEAPVEPAQQASTTTRRYIAPVVLAAAAAQADEPQISSTSTIATPEANTDAEQVLGDSSSKDNNTLGFVLIGLAVAGFAVYALRSRFASREK